MIKNNVIKVYKLGHAFLNKHNIRPLFIRKLNQFIIKKLKTNYVEIGGHKIYLDEHDSLRLSTRGYFEPETNEVFQKYIKKGDTVIDIGAHIGYHTLSLAKLVGEKGKVYAFEPCPNNFNLLKKNIEVNGYTNVELIQKAVSNFNGKSDLLINKKNSGAHHLSNKKDNGCIGIDVLKLDTLPIKPNFIKMDIEGREYLALEGMKELLTNNKVTLVTEFNPSLIKETNKPERFISLLKETGFDNIYTISKELSMFDLNKLNQYIPKIKRGTTNINLLCIKKK